MRARGGFIDCLDPADVLQGACLTCPPEGQTTPAFRDSAPADRVSSRDRQPSPARAARPSGSHRSASPQVGQSAPGAARKGRVAGVRGVVEQPLFEIVANRSGLCVVPVRADIPNNSSVESSKVDQKVRGQEQASRDEDIVLVRPVCCVGMPREGKHAKNRGTGTSPNQSRPDATSPSAHAEQFPGARPPKEAAEAEHRRALAEAAAQTRLDRRRVMAKMCELERSNAETLRDRGGEVGDGHRFQALRCGGENLPAAGVEPRRRRPGDESAHVQGGGDGPPTGQPRTDRKSVV